MPWKYLKMFLPQNGHIDTFFFFSRIVNGIQMGLLTCEMLHPFFSPFPHPPSLCLFITFAAFHICYIRFWVGWENVRLGQCQSLM